MKKAPAVFAGAFFVDVAVARMDAFVTNRITRLFPETTFRRLF